MPCGWWPSTSMIVFGFCGGLSQRVVHPVRSQRFKHEARVSGATLTVQCETLLCTDFAGLRGQILCLDVRPGRRWSPGSCLGVHGSGAAEDSGGCGAGLRSSSGLLFSCPVPTSCPLSFRGTVTAAVRVLSEAVQHPTGEDGHDIDGVREQVHANIFVSCLCRIGHDGRQTL